MISRTRKSLITHFGHFSGYLFRGIAVAAMASALLLTASTPSKALTFNWSFVTAGDSDNVGQTVSGLISGLHEGDNYGSELDDLYVRVTDTPTGELLLDDWAFDSLTDPATTIAFTVTGGVMTFANAAFFIGGDHKGPELYFTLNDSFIGWYAPMLADRNIPVYWYRDNSDSTEFSIRKYYEIHLDLSWAQAPLASDGQRFITAAAFNTAPTSFVAAPEVPLPAALPLFAAGLSAMGFVGWLKRKALSAA